MERRATPTWSHHTLSNDYQNHLRRGICVEAPERRYPMSLAYPTGEEPTLWIKYGCAVSWEEVVHQFRAHQELRKIDSPVRVPAIYYACQDKVTKETYIVMEYIRGDTVNSLILKSHESPEQSREIQEALSRRVLLLWRSFYASLSLLAAPLRLSAEALYGILSFSNVRRPELTTTPSSWSSISIW